MIYLILILGFILRLINLNQSLWLDEAITAVAVRTNSFDQLITQFAPGDFHPPLYYLFLKFWTNIFGFSEIALRLPSVIFGLVAIYFVYLLGKKYGLRAALLLAVNPLAIYYSQEARMYSMAMMLVTGSIWFLQNKKWSWFYLFAAASIYTDYLPILMFPVYFFLASDKKKIVVPLVYFLPWLPSLFVQLKTGLSISNSSWGDLLGRANFKNLFLVPAKFIFGRISLPIAVYAVFSGLYGLLILRVKNIPSWLWLLVPLILGFLLSFKVPVFTYFRFIFVLPALMLLLAENKKAVLVVSLVSILSIGYFNFNPNFWREDWRGTTAYINSDPGKVEMPSLAQSAPLIYYGAIMDKKESPVYLIRYVQEIFDPQDILRKNLEMGNYKRVEEKTFNGILIWKYKI